MHRVFAIPETVKVLLVLSSAQRSPRMMLWMLAPQQRAGRAVQLMLKVVVKTQQEGRESAAVGSHEREHARLDPPWRRFYSPFSSQISSDFSFSYTIPDIDNNIGRLC